MAEALSVPPVSKWPLYWFARLEQAIQQGDHQTAAHAQRQLRRLGVQVRYGRPKDEAVPEEVAQ